jgi:hypothetical protein
MPRMPKRLILVAIAATLLIAAPAASADTPVRDTFTQHTVVQDDGEDCGFPVLWDIHMTVDRTRWYDEAGRITREIQQVREDNTLHNLATGKVLRDGPVRFMRRHFYENGVRQFTVDRGLMFNVNDGGERLVDRGRVQFRVVNGIWDILSPTEDHPVYGYLDGKPFSEVTGAFCGILD